MSLSTVRTAYASCSLGSPDGGSPLLPDKLTAIAAAGFEGIELSMPDLQAYATSLDGHEVSNNDYDSLCRAAEATRDLCRQHGLAIVMLQPFGNFEGWPAHSRERADAFERAAGWIRIMAACGTDMLQVGSSDSEGINPDKDLVARDLAELADLLADHGFRLAYENWCWSTHAPTWADVWELVEWADRPNVGLCLDTFQTAGSEWADPSSMSGMIEDQTQNHEHSDGKVSTLAGHFQVSLARLAETVPADKIYIFQVSDAYQPNVPLSTETVDGMGPRARWSHYYRPLPFHGGYLPVVDVVKAVLDTGFRGWFSTEIFDAGPDGAARRDGDIRRQAQDGMAAHRKLLAACEEHN